MACRPGPDGCSQALRAPLQACQEACRLHQCAQAHKRRPASLRQMDAAKPCRFPAQAFLQACRIRQRAQAYKSRPAGAQAYKRRPAGLLQMVASRACSSFVCLPKGLQPLPAHAGLQPLACRLGPDGCSQALQASFAALPPSSVRAGLQVLACRRRPAPGGSSQALEGRLTGLPADLLPYQCAQTCRPAADGCSQSLKPIKNL